MPGCVPSWMRSEPRPRAVDRAARASARSTAGQYSRHAEEEHHMTDPIVDIIGDYGAFAAQQRDRLLTRGIDIAPYALSHIAYRVAEWDEYLKVRGLLERHAVANRENVWNGRPISLIVFDQLEVLDGKALPMIELIP